MKTVFLDRTGQLKNTTWAILSPDGKEKLTRAGRGPFHEYRNAELMTSGMNKIATQYNVALETVGSDTQLPFAESVDVGLNISAADNIPMIVVISNDKEKATALKTKLLPLAWKDDSIIGQFTFAKTTDAKELEVLTGVEGEADKLNSILVVEPGQFGLSGKVLSQLDLTVSDEDLKSSLVESIKNCKRIEKGHNSHVDLGIKLGIDWESEIPESDPESAAARKRKRGN